MIKAIVIGMLIALSATPALARHKHHRIDPNGNRFVSSDAPSGCPRALYCGCALAIKIFGRIIPGLNSSGEWPRRFARDVPAPGNVAYNSRRGGGHVMQLLSHVQGTVWRVWDPNTRANGRRNQTVIKEVDIRGKTIVNPRSARTAMR